ncbi:hypothetical protein VSR34_36370 [Paraburkholderia sp. JHI2823]|uniref:hypothetical protein n=1 Tax=Paraburkholderia sp. JHI2823 TaxID=3112960 RepID=UPI00316C7BE1
MPRRAPRGTSCGAARTGRLLSEPFKFLRLGCVARPHRFETSFQHTRVIAQVALRALTVASRALLRTLQFALQTRIRRAFTLNLEQRALLRGLQARLGQLRAGPLPVEFGGKIGARLRQGGVPLAQRLLRTRQLAFRRFARCRGRSLRLFEFLDPHLCSEQRGRVVSR